MKKRWLFKTVKALNNRMVDPSTIFIDGTHIKASANKKKFQKEQVKKAAKVYSGQLRREVNAEREKLGKKPVEDDEDDSDPQNPTGGTSEKTVSTTDPDSGMFVKGEHESVHNTYLARVSGFSRADTQNRARKENLCTAQRDDWTCLRGCKREARDEIYTPQRLGRSHKMGQA